MSDTLDEILAELSVKKADGETEEKLSAMSENPLEETASGESVPTDERSLKVAAFQLHLDIDSEFGEYQEPPLPDTTGEEESAASDVPKEEEALSSETEEPLPLTESESAEQPETAPQEEPQKAKRKKKRAPMDEKERALWGCAGGMFYVLAILGVSLVLACIVIMAALDLTGLGKSGKNVRIVVEDDATSRSISTTLKEQGLINHPFFFKLYSNITGEDSEFKSGVYTFSANMGYGNIVDMLRAGVPRKIVKVTIPEGYTVDKIAVLMEENSVCTKKEFCSAVLGGDYSDFSFVASLPKDEGTYAGRGYALEGYLYPDTYEFYTGSTGETVVRKLLTNFDNRIDTAMKAQIAATGMSLNEVVTLASIVQAEAGSDEWSKVAHVLLNRMQNPSLFPKMQCDSTFDYYENMDLTVEGLTVDPKVYDSYTHVGLIPGAISNPGMKAIQAVLQPATIAEIKGYMAYRADADVEGNAFVRLEYKKTDAAGNYYFFATDLDTGVTYYTQHQDDHNRVCSHYGI